MSAATKTIDHGEIRRWIEQRGGRPARVRDTGGRGDAGLLRVDFDDPGSGDDRLEEVSWDDFFATFDENKLAFLHQDETSGRDQSRFNKFVER
jgi:hypothetical protein